ncbi:glycosyltransferase [Mycetocola manganoxydans]|uniref:Glycosyltransferase n=1 Tax=Mycetocola manganoxydans TaxID=699879 RepID=A0A3L6ZMG0_9MICO|nr:glycosyltransferase [Mycetocola manganoxydans]
MLLLTGGSRGDVEPFAALARAAAAHGHSVRLGVPDNSGADLSGIDAVSLRIDFATLAPQGLSALSAARAFTESIRPAMKRFLATAVREALTFAPDLIVYHPKVLSAPLVADALGVPHVLVEMVPSVTSTRAFPAPAISRANLGPLNRATYTAVNSAGALFRRELAAARTLLPRPSTPTPTPPSATLLPISPQLLRRPKDWPATVHLTGAWRDEDSHGHDDPALESFIAGGPFLYAGFGSMVGGDPVGRAVAIIESARTIGCRVVAAEGWGGLRVPGSHRTDDVFVAQTVPHGSVLPRATAAIHHGGAGTVHAVARAGIPSIVVPFLADQPFWGQRVHTLGLGPAPIPRKKLTKTRLDAALARMDSFRERAERTGALVRSERGLEYSIRVLESLVR